MGNGRALARPEWGPEVLERGERQRDNERFLPDVERPLPASELRRCQPNSLSHGTALFRCRKP